MNKNAKQTAEILLDIKAVTLSPNKPFVFVSGIHSPIYTDNRLLMGYPKERREITTFMTSLIKTNNIDAGIIAGTATAGIAPAAWIAEMLELPMIFVRKQLKEYGTGKLVEGIVKPSRNIILVEDVISTGKSSINAVNAIRNEKGKVDTCVAFFEYGFKKTREKFKDQKIDLFTLTTLDILVETAMEKNIIKASDQTLIMSWRDDPWAWTENAKKRKKDSQPTEY